MKRLRVITVICFVLIILIPVLTFNFEENAISVIDNRELAKNPFSISREALGEEEGYEEEEYGEEEETGLTENIENYVSDRIGLRDEMILSYTILNDRIFGKMVHPSYIYGKEGYVFGAGRNVYPGYGEYQEVFADMVLKIQDYCMERNVPFLFVFEPAKPAVLTQYLPEGENYDREWVDLFLKALDGRGINYVDNTVILREKTAEGEAVFNKKYDANHWNDLGALYGTNEILAAMQEEIPQVHVNGEEDIVYDEILETTLPVSEFPIEEMVPSIEVLMSCDSLTEEYEEELSLNESYDAFGYYVNQERLDEGAPRALVFQGSYINVYGYKYLENGLGEYIYVHDYQNVIDFPYYFNIFKPEYVVFEAAEYTFNNEYYDFERMAAMELNPTLASALDDSDDIEEKKLRKDSLTVEKGKKLTKIIWNTDSYLRRGWLRLGGDVVYDLNWTESGYETTILTEEYRQYRDEMEIFAIEGNDTICYKNRIFPELVDFTF